MKGLKITNIILLCLSILTEIISLTFIFPVFSALIHNNGGQILASLLALLPMFILTSIVILIFAIILTITSKKWKSAIVANQQSTKFFVKMCGWLSWVFLFINILLFASIYIFAGK
ncbi:MAG: hypothetical protein IJW32_02080 [Clostridia bacterium]|nr:hypothetical protein [Clostridia bacterium]